MWECREREWERERQARKRLMNEVHSHSCYCLLLLFTVYWCCLLVLFTGVATSYYLLLVDLKVFAERQEQLQEKMKSLQLQQVHLCRMSSPSNQDTSLIRTPSFVSMYS